MITPSQRFTSQPISRRSFLRGLASAGVGTVLLAACNGSSTQNSASLRVWGAIPAELGPQDLVDDFMRKHPGINVTYTRYVGDEAGVAKFETALAAGDQIDVYFYYDVPRMSQSIKTGLAEHLEPYVTAAGGSIARLASREDIFRQDGKLYSLPTTWEASYLMINRDLTDAAGITIADSWDQTTFRDALKKIVASSKGKIRYGILDAPDFARESLGSNYWYKDGGKSANFDNPAFRKSWEYKHDLIFNDKSEFPWTEVLAQNLRNYSQNTFLQQQVATIVSASWMLRYVGDTKQYPHSWVTTFAPVPAPDGVALPYNMGGYTNSGSLNNWIMMSSQSKVKDAAWTFISYWLTDGAKYMLKGGKVPAILEGRDLNEVTAGILGPDRDRLFDVAAWKKVALAPDTKRYKYYVDSVTTGAAKIRALLMSQTDRYYIGEITIDELISTVQQQANAAIQEG